MNEYTLVLSTQKSGVVYYDGNNLGLFLEFSKPYTIKTKNQNAYFSFYPISEDGNDNIKILPYTFQLHLDSICQSSCKYIDIINHPNHCAEIILHDNSLEILKNSTLYNDSVIIAGTTINIQIVYGSKNSIHLEYQSKIFDFSFEYRLTNINTYTLKHKENNYIIIGANVSNFEYVSIFYIKDSSIEKIGEFVADTIEIIRNNIKVLIKDNDMFGHGKISVYEIDNGKIKKIKKYLTCVYGKQKTHNELQLIPYAFFESIKCNDFVNARQYLTDGLSNQLSDTHIVQYFGKFIDVRPTLNNDENSVALIYEQNKIKKAKYVKIDFLDNKIDNIDFTNE